MRVLVLGGTGVFGSRLGRLLAGDERMEVTAAARNRDAVDALAAELGISCLALGRRKPRGWVVEQFGPFAFDLELPLADDGDVAGHPRRETTRRAAARFLWPYCDSSEFEQDGRYRFDVMIGLPLVGRLVRHCGLLTDR